MRYGQRCRQCLWRAGMNLIVQGRALRVLGQLVLGLHGDFLQNGRFSSRQQLFRLKIKVLHRNRFTLLRVKFENHCVARFVMF